MKDYDRATEVSPDEPVAYTARGNLYETLSQNMTVHSKTITARRCLPQTIFRPYLARGSFFSARKQYELALKDLQPRHCVGSKGHRLVTGFGVAA